MGRTNGPGDGSPRGTRLGDRGDPGPAAAVGGLGGSPLGARQTLLHVDFPAPGLRRSQDPEPRDPCGGRGRAHERDAAPARRRSAWTGRPTTSERSPPRWRSRKSYPVLSRRRPDLLSPAEPRAVLTAATTESPARPADAPAAEGRPHRTWERTHPRDSLGARTGAAPPIAGSRPPVASQLVRRPQSIPPGRRGWRLSGLSSTVGWTARLACCGQALVWGQGSWCGARGGRPSRNETCHGLSLDCSSEVGDHKVRPVTPSGCAHL
jgi:hypothetical protein